MYRTVAVVFALFVATVVSRPTGTLEGIYKDCKDYPDKDFKVTSVVVAGCTAPPCKFKKGGTGNVNVTFTSISTDDVPAAYANMCGDIGITCANLQLEKNNLCDLGAKCPIKNGDTNTISISIPISKSYPSIELTAYSYAELDAKDTDRKDSVMCFEVEIQLTE